MVGEFRRPRRVAVGAMQADAASTQLLREHRAQLERWSQFHAHRRRQVLFGEQRQPSAIYPLLSEVLQRKAERKL